MNQLEILQDQFNDAAKSFPDMIHLIKWFRISSIESNHKVKFEPDRLGFLPLAIVNQINRKAVETPSKYEPTPANGPEQLINHILTILTMACRCDSRRKTWQQVAIIQARKAGRWFVAAPGVTVPNDAVQLFA